MIYEYRVYKVAPGRMDDLHNRFKNHALKFFEKYNIKVIGFFTTMIGERDDCLIYILEFESLSHREKAWEDFESDKEWKKIVKESNKEGTLVLRVRNQILKPTDYSNLGNLNNKEI